MKFNVAYVRVCTRIVERERYKLYLERETGNVCDDRVDAVFCKSRTDVLAIKAFLKI